MLIKFFSKKFLIGAVILIYFVNLLIFPQIMLARYNHYDHVLNFSLQNNMQNNFIGHNTSYILFHGLIARATNNHNLQFFILDKKNSVLKITDKKNKIHYSAYGIPQTKFKYNFSPFAFNGERFDWHTNLLYLKARFYTTQLKRFINQDNFFVLNRFNFADNNPIMKFDPSGHMVMVAAAWTLLNLILVGFTTYNDVSIAQHSGWNVGEIGEIILNIATTFSMLSEGKVVHSLAKEGKFENIVQKIKNMMKTTTEEAPLVRDVNSFEEVVTITRPDGLTFERTRHSHIPVLSNSHAESQMSLASEGYLYSHSSEPFLPENFSVETIFSGNEDLDTILPINFSSPSFNLARVNNATPRLYLHFNLDQLTRHLRFLQMTAERERCGIIFIYQEDKFLYAALLNIKSEGIFINGNMTNMSDSQFYRLATTSRFGFVLC